MTRPQGRDVEVPLAEGVACERTYQVIVDDEPKPLLCRWFAPEPHPEGGWTCRMEIHWPNRPVRRRTAGAVDSTQALLLAFASVATEIFVSDHVVYWYEEDDDLGLTTPDHHAEDTAARKARFYARLRARPLWNPVLDCLWTELDPLGRVSVHETCEASVRNLIGLLEGDHPVQRIADFVSELRSYIEQAEVSDTQADLAIAHKLLALVTRPDE